MIRPSQRAVHAVLTVALLAACTGPIVSPTPPRGPNSSPASSGAPSASPWAMPPLEPFEVAFTTEDGLAIIGTLRGDGPVGVILCHMFRGQASDWTPLADALVEAGYRVLAINFRGNGRSQPPLEVPVLHLDIEAAARFLRARGVQP